MNSITNFGHSTRFAGKKFPHKCKAPLHFIALLFALALLCPPMVLLLILNPYIMKTTAEIQRLDVISEIELIYRSKVKASERPHITSSRRAYEIALQNWDDNRIEFIEQCKIMLLSQSHKVLGIYEMSSGGIAGTVVDLRLLFTAALKAAAVNVIIIHNHPSGNTAPSEADRQITSKAVQAGKLLDVKILDHLIISSESYYSFADDGAL